PRRVAPEPRAAAAPPAAAPPAAAPPAAAPPAAAPAVAASVPAAPTPAPPPAAAARARAATSATAPATASAASAEPLADRAEAVSGTFRQNRGRLPWPTDGTLTGSFGARRDPVYGTTVESIGIDIATRAAAPVRAVFDGMVERVDTSPTYGTYVIVSHGGYTTFYGNLSQVVVRSGQRLSAGQVLGRSGTVDSRRGTGLFFALFEGDRAVNPTGWLRGR
ncbi:MAG: murein hydrolase activator EnvC family protein, partial [Rubricoccaceae bacterium]